VRWQGIIAALLLGCASAALLLRPARAADPDPYQIFARSRAYWLQQQYPPSVAYTVAVDVVEGGKERVERYEASMDGITGAVTVDPVSDYQLAHPLRATGANLSFFGVRLNKPLPQEDFLGVPHLAPSYSFGMAPFVPAPTPTPFDSNALVAQIRRDFHDPNPRVTPAPRASDGLREIATVVARNRDYTISLLGIESVDGHACYHLALAPTREPGRFRIRQAWIDESSFAPWRLIDAVNFSNGPGTGVAWTIDFADVGGAHYIATEAADAPMSVSGEIYSAATIRFENIHPGTLKRPDLGVPGSGLVLEEP